MLKAAFDIAPYFSIQHSAFSIARAAASDRGAFWVL